MIKVSMLTHTTPHKSLRMIKIKVDICNHQVDSSLVPDLTKTRYRYITLKLNTVRGKNITSFNWYGRGNTLHHLSCDPVLSSVPVFIIISHSDHDIGTALQSAPSKGRSANRINP